MNRTPKLTSRGQESEPFLDYFHTVPLYFCLKSYQLDYIHFQDIDSKSNKKRFIYLFVFVLNTNLPSSNCHSVLNKYAIIFTIRFQT